MRAARHYHHEVVHGDQQKMVAFVCSIRHSLTWRQNKALLENGTIGKRVGEIAKVFCMTVLIAEHRKNRPPAKK